MPIRMARLIRALTADDDRDGARENPEVEADRPVLDVVAVETHDFVEVDDFAPAADLPQAREARLHREAAEVMRLVILEIRFEERAWAHERHVAGEDVVELRQLVETPATNDAAEPRHAGIRRD